MSPVWLFCVHAPRFVRLRGQNVVCSEARASVIFTMLYACASCQSGVTTFEFGLSSTPTGDALGLPDVFPLVPVGLAKQAVGTGVALLPGEVYYGVVRSRVRTGACAHHPVPAAVHNSVETL